MNYKKPPLVKNYLKGLKNAKNDPKNDQIWPKLKISHNSANFQHTVFFESL